MFILHTPLDGSADKGDMVHQINNFSNSQNKKQVILKRKVYVHSNKITKTSNFGSGYLCYRLKHTQKKTIIIFWKCIEKYTRLYKLACKCSIVF